jgi:hypothetical protein
MPSRSLCALALVAATIAFAGARTSAGPAEKPFVFDHTAILQGDGAVYYVEGRVRIPKGVEITVGKDTTIVGRGEDATIEVEGELIIHGVFESRVTVSGVTIELKPKFDTVRADAVVFTKGSKGIVSVKDEPVDGRLSVQNCTFDSPASVSVSLLVGSVDLQSSDFGEGIYVHAVDPPGSTGNKVKLFILNCGGSSFSLKGGIHVEKVSDVTVRSTVIDGSKATFLNCGAVTFDANYVRCKTLEFIQEKPGRFGRTIIQKCDVQCEKIVLFAPTAPGKAEKIPCDKCWFNGETKEKAVREKFFQDKDDDPENNVTVDILKIMEKPLQLAGAVRR